MIFILLLPILTFAGSVDVDQTATETSADRGYASSSSWGSFDEARYGNKRKHGRSRTGFVREIHVLNGSKLSMECAPAEYIVRTHMAPDFESPQLVRKLDWFHDGALIASYQQDAISGISEEWWVASTRHELRRPFYQLRVAPTLASDSGEYKCVLETDPLFTLDQSVMTVRLVVTVKPPAPSKPVVSGADQAYIGQNGREEKTVGNGGLVLVSWNHSIGAAHRPILRYSVMITRLDDSTNLRILTTDSNRTSKIVNGLSPNVHYAFSVRAENAAGESEFSSETVFITRITAPKNSPKIISIRNQTENDPSTACVEVEWTFDDMLVSRFMEISGYRITVVELLSSSSSNSASSRAREWHIKRSEKRADAILCSLEFGGEFQLKIEADTDFGVSPPAVTVFRTIESVPADPPAMISVWTGGDGVAVLRWEEPERRNGRITSYQIYLREKHRSSAPPALIRLLLRPEDASKSFAYNITDIEPNRTYEIQLSASTAKGEGVKSRPVVLQNDNLEIPAPRILAINYECALSSAGQNSVLIEWTNVAKASGLAQWRNKSLTSGEKLTTEMEYFYRVEFEDSRRKFTLNATSNFVKIDNLEQGRRHSVAVIAVYRLTPEDSSFRDTAPSKVEYFKIHEDSCQLHSSICSTENNNCRAIVAKVESAKYDTPSLFLILLGVLSTMFLSIVFTIFLKRHCSFFRVFVYSKKKSEMKKLKKSNGMLCRESVSLINNTLLLDVSESTYGHTVAAAEFDDYFAELSAVDNEGFARQFRELNDDSVHTSPTIPVDASTTETDGGTLLVENGIKTSEDQRYKNRYVNVLAAEHSRIRINRTSKTSRLVDSTADESKLDDGYINANYIDSCDEKNVYIATQAPLPHTFADFWAMVWQENCNVIVMIANLIEGGKRKCDQYWPSQVRSKMQFGSEDGKSEFEVVLSAENTNSIFTHRVFTLLRLSDSADGANKANGSTRIATLGWKRDTTAGSQKIVHQLQFTSWPDHGVPETVFPLLHFMNCVMECHNSCQSGSMESKSNKFTTTNSLTTPIIVHCSAGIGRSGSFILIDSMRRHLTRCDRINIQSHLRRMRRQRACLVQTLEQYIFCHDALRSLINHGVSRQSAVGFSSYLHFLLSEFLPVTPNGIEQNFIRPQSQMQKQFESVCKCKHNPPCRRERSKESVISLPGYYRMDEFLLASWPSECAEFWSTVWTKRCPLILLLGSDAEVGDFFRTTRLTNSAAALWNVIGLSSNNMRTSANGFGKANGVERALSPISPTNDTTKMLYTSLISEENSDEFTIRINVRDIVFDVKVLMVRPSVLETNVWSEIERIQDQLLQCGDARESSIQQPMMLLDPRSINSSMPFILCALQSAACQLEAERSLDVLLYLAWYKHISCGCWSTQGNIEYIYAKLMELIHLKEVRV